MSNNEIRDLSQHFTGEAVLRAARAMLQQDLGHKLTWGQIGEEAQLRYLAGARAALRCGTAEVLAELENLRKYAETTKYHQDQHAAAVRELERVRDEFLRWLVRLDEPNDAQGSADRQTVTLNQIIEKARKLLGDVR